MDRGLLRYFSILMPPTTHPYPASLSFCRTILLINQLMREGTFLNMAKRSCR